LRRECLLLTQGGHYGKSACVTNRSVRSSRLITIWRCVSGFVTAVDRLSERRRCKNHRRNCGNEGSLALSVIILLLFTKQPKARRLLLPHLRSRWPALRRREPVAHFRWDCCALFRRSSDWDFQSGPPAGGQTAVETFVRNECSRESRKRTLRGWLACSDPRRCRRRAA
jgi:hypothetical protein